MKKSIVKYRAFAEFQYPTQREYVDKPYVAGIEIIEFDEKYLPSNFGELYKIRAYFSTAQEAVNQMCRLKSILEHDAVSIAYGSLPDLYESVEEEVILEA